MWVTAAWPNFGQKFLGKLHSVLHNSKLKSGIKFVENRKKMI